MKIRPLHDWAVIRRIDAGEKTAGGIIIPAVARERPAEGIVEAIGPGKYSAEGKGKKERFVATTVRPGQRVVFANFAARDVEIDGQEITLVREEDILGIHLGSQHLALKESSPVSVKEGMPLLVRGEAHAKPAVPEKPGKSGVAAGARASGKDAGAKKKTVKKTSGTQLQKKTKAAKEKKQKARKTTGKAERRSTRKTARKSIRAKRPGTASGKIARKPGGRRKVAAKKTRIGKKKSVSGKSRAKRMK